MAQAPQFSDTIDDIVLAADTLLRVAIPVGAGFVALSFDADIRVKPGLVDTALALLLASAADRAGSALNPGVGRPPRRICVCGRPAPARARWNTGAETLRSSPSA